jgi:hypothetical protein
MLDSQEPSKVHSTNRFLSRFSRTDKKIGAHIVVQVT